eukprot:285060-Prymnesium_polylepis.1
MNTIPDHGVGPVGARGLWPMMRRVARHGDRDRDAWCVGSWPDDLGGTATWSSRGVSSKSVNFYMHACSPGAWDIGLGSGGAVARTHAHPRLRPPAEVSVPAHARTSSGN